MSLPNLVIIGAPKCGTTSLHFYLDQHPAVSMSTTKELRYFNRDDWMETREWYEAQFSEFTTPIRGEATPRYARYPEWRDVPRRMHALIPEASLIYLVRDPIARCISHWAEVQQWSSRGRTSLNDYLVDYDNPANPIVCASRYATQLEQYLEYFPQEQLLVIDQDALKHARRATLREIFRFLNIDESFDSALFDDERNTRSDKRALTSSTSALWNRVLGPMVRRLPAASQEPIRRRTLRALSQPITERPEIDPAIRPGLEALLGSEAQRLRALTGKAFASWSV
jgi:hypothetical protein